MQQSTDGLTVEQSGGWSSGGQVPSVGNVYVDGAVEGAPSSVEKGSSLEVGALLAVCWASHRPESPWTLSPEAHCIW